MNVSFSRLVDLDRQTRELAAARTPSDVFKGLLDAARLAAPRAAIFLIRQGKLQGWGSVGYPADVTAAQRGFTGSLETGWIGELVRTPEALGARPPGSADPSFGQAPAHECAGIFVRIKGKPIAFVMVERAAGDDPWFPEALAMTITMAQLRLELDLALRKLGAAAPEPKAQPALAPEVAVPTPEVAAPVQPEAVAVTEDAPAPLPALATESSPELDAARRYARLVATDIRLYNEEAVVLGRKDGDLQQRLLDQLGRGKETFVRRHGALGPGGLQILHEAYVQVLAGGDAGLLPVSVVE